MLEDTYSQNPAILSLFLPIWKAIWSNFVNTFSKLKAFSQHHRWESFQRREWLISHQFFLKLRGGRHGSRLIITISTTNCNKIWQNLLGFGCPLGKESVQKEKKEFYLVFFPTASRVVVVVKNLPANAGDARDEGSIPGGGHGSPRQYSCLNNSIDWGAWQAIVHGATKGRHDWACTCDAMMLVQTIKVLEFLSSGWGGKENSEMKLWYLSACVCMWRTIQHKHQLLCPRKKDTPWTSQQKLYCNNAVI